MEALAILTNYRINFHSLAHQKPHDSIKIAHLELSKEFFIFSTFKTADS